MGTGIQAGARLDLRDTWKQWERAGYEAPGSAEGKCSECQGVHPVVKRRLLKIGKLSYAVLWSVFSRTGSRGRPSQR